jgi:hypothetical protein
MATVKVKYNVKGVDSRGGPRVKPGAYVVSVKQIEVGESKNKDPMMTIEFQIIKNADGSKSEFKGQTVRNWILLDHSDEGVREGGQARLRQFLEAVGVVQGKKGESGSLDTDKVEGTELQIQIKSDKDQDGEYMPRVGKMFGLDAGSDAEEEDEPDEADDDSEDEDESDDDESDDDDDEDEEDEDSDDEDDEDDAVDLDELDRDALKAFAKEEGLSLKGKEPGKVSKNWSDDDIRKMIAEAMEAKDGDDDDDDEEDADEAPDYDSWDAKQLKAELKERGIELEGRFSSSKAKKALKDDDKSDKDPF